MAPPHLAENLVGRRYGRLTVTSFICRNNWHSWWLCQCDCGGETPVRMNTLKRGKTLSCGCHRRERAIAIRSTHGHTRGGKLTPTYVCYRSMLSRCFNARNHAYADYGGRGITVCEAWKSNFEQFLGDMGERPDGTSLHRIENDLGYNLSNCVWGTPQQQAAGRRSSRFIVVRGVRKCASEAARDAGLAPTTVLARIRDEWPESEWLVPLKRVRRRPAQAALG